MSKKKWTNIKILGAEINTMREAGKSRQEIADYFGLDKVQIKNGVHRYNKNVRHSELRHAQRGVRAKTGNHLGRTKRANWNGFAWKQAVAGFSAIHRKEVRPKVKYHVIYRNRERYPISVMCRFFEVSRSGYDDFVHRLECKEKVQIWRKLSAFSKGAASRYMDIDGCGCGWRNKVRAAIPR